MPPICQYCGKKLKKSGRELLVFRASIDMNRAPVRREEIQADVATKEEAQRLTNKIILSVKRYPYSKLIASAILWDGSSYGVDAEGLFCTKACGYQFGRAIAQRYFKKARD